MRPDRKADIFRRGKVLILVLKMYLYLKHGNQFILQVCFGTNIYVLPHNLILKYKTTKMSLLDLFEYAKMPCNLVQAYNTIRHIIILNVTYIPNMGVLHLFIHALHSQSVQFSRGMYHFYSSKHCYSELLTSSVCMLNKYTDSSDRHNTNT